MTTLTTAVPTMPPTQVGGIVAPRRGRVAAMLTVLCVLGHVPLLLVHAATQPLLSLAMAGVAVACLGCVRPLGRGPTRRTWSTVLGLSAAMVALHIPMALSGHGPGSATLPGVLANGAALGHHSGHLSSDLAGAVPVLHPGLIAKVTMAIALVQVGLGQRRSCGHDVPASSGASTHGRARNVLPRGSDRTRSAAGQPRPVAGGSG